MLFLLVILLISELLGGIEARPLLLSSALNTTSCLRDLPPPPSDDFMDHRLTADIVWSCIATIFACTWVSLHPNIPGIKDGKTREVLVRIELTIWSIIVPEMIMLWALRQWRGARHIRHKYAGLSRLGELFCVKISKFCHLNFRVWLDDISWSFHPNGRFCIGTGRR